MKRMERERGKRWRRTPGRQSWKHRGDSAAASLTVQNRTGSAKERHLPSIAQPSELCVLEGTGLSFSTPSWDNSPLLWEGHLTPGGCSPPGGRQRPSQRLLLGG